MFRQIALLCRRLPTSILPMALAVLTLSPSPSLGQDKKPAAKQFMEVDLGGIHMIFVRIEPGKFKMGSPNDEPEREPYEKGSELQHEVEITKPFFMSVYTVTQAEFARVMGKNPSYFSRHGEGKEKVAGIGTGRFPVENLTWHEAVDFCGRLSQKQEKMFDLPTEAEWEYACRAGGTGAFHHGNSLSSKQANFHGDFPYGGADKGPNLGRTMNVGSFAANAYGLHDMHGNVWQWCKDWYKSDYHGESPPRDPPGPATGKSRVLRGGAWGVSARVCRSACRYGYGPDDRSSDVGFRVVIR